MRRLKKYTDQCFSRLKKHLRKYSKDDDVEILHKIRVEIKKIKAVIKLTNDSVIGFHGHRAFVPLRTIFRAAGKIRQPEVLYGLLLRHEIEIGNLHIPFEEKEASLSRKFQKKIPDYILNVQAQKHKLKNKVGKVKRAQVKKYLEEKEKALWSQLQAKWTAPTLHKARKITKDILYVGAVLQKDGKSNFFDQLQELIGQWHDRQTLLPMLVKYKSPEAKRLKAENAESLANLSKFIFDHKKDTAT